MCRRDPDPDLRCSLTAHSPTHRCHLRFASRSQGRPYVQPAPYVQPTPYVPPAPRFASVTFVGLLIAPGKADGTRWDFGGDISPEVTQQLSMKLAAREPYLALAVFVAGVAMPATAKPDVAGTAVILTSAGVDQSYSLPKVQDNFTPDWNVTWRHVPLDGSARIRVQSWDADLVNNDPLGTFEIGAPAISAAIADGGVFPVRVDGQTNSQILFARISAMAE